MALPEIMLARIKISVLNGTELGVTTRVSPLKELGVTTRVSPLNGARGHHAIIYLQVKDESQGAAEGTRQPISFMMQNSLKNDF